MTTVYAHAGHWFAGLAYAAPVFILMGWLGVVRLKDKRALRGAAGDSGAKPSPEASRKDV